MTLEIETYAADLCRAAEADGISLRLFGSCAISIKCAQYCEIFNRCKRRPKDIDAVVRRTDRNRLRSMLLARGWEENLELTAQTDGNQLRFRDPKSNLPLDVCVDTLRFSQTLDVRKRIELDSPTLPVADLLLSKLQIRDLTISDLSDLIALLYAVPPNDSDANSIDLCRIVDVTRHSWRWYTSVMLSLQTVDQALGNSPCDLTHADQRLVGLRLKIIENRMVEAPKTLPWKMRSIIGQSLPWYDKVEIDSASL
jgi:hypothetical protein